jgi:hypothetical protein
MGTWFSFLTAQGILILLSGIDNEAGLPQGALRRMRASVGLDDQLA